MLTGHDCWPSDYMNEAPEQAFMQAWSHNMTVAIEPFMVPEESKTHRLPNRRAPKRGVFAAACYTHSKCPSPQTPPFRPVWHRN